MLISTLKSIFERDLYRVKEEISLYKRDQNLWVTENEISNAAGNLCLHLIGNLRTYIGKEIGKVNYVRHRDLEFSSNDIPRLELIKQIEETLSIVSNSLDKLNDQDLYQKYPLIVFDEEMSMGYFLVHLTTHLSYHLGQINYHRRILDK